MSLKPLKAVIVNRKINTVRGKVEWLKIHWISVSKDKPLQFRYKYSINNLECWKTVNLQRRTKGRPPDMGRVILPYLYDGPRAVNSKKVSDLLELLDYIPPVYHGFYRQLHGTDSRMPASGSDTESSDED